MNDNSFNSIEKLMEFGMSMAIAQQMMQTMNHALNNMQTPQFSNLSMPLAAQIMYYALVNDIPQGPFTESEINNFIITKSIDEDTLIWNKELPGWMAAKQVPVINKLFLINH
jgi:hypothetical protein